MIRFVMPGLGRRTPAKVFGFFADRKGVTAVIVALAFTGILGFTGLGTEVGGWYVTKRTMQGAVDAAAFSAAVAHGADTSYTGEVNSVAAKYGFVNGANGVTLAVHNPPISGTHAGNSAAFEVVIQQPQPQLFSKLFLPLPSTISARAVAMTTNGGGGCVLALDRASVVDLTGSGSVNVDLNSCSLYVNSPSTDDTTLNGGTTINTDAAYLSGNYVTTGHAALNASHGVSTYQPPAADPYAGDAIPSYSGCNPAYSGQSEIDASAYGGVYVFCGGLTVNAHATLTLGPGVYIMDQGTFSVMGNATINGTGVTIILTSSTGSNYATAAIHGNATLNLSAPTSGPLSGLAFFQDRNAPSSGSNDFSGGTTQNINGALYFPNENVKFAGGTSTGGAVCTQIVALTITFDGNAEVNDNCSGIGTAAIGTSQTALVE